MENNTILAAVADYNNSSNEHKERVWEFFKSLDTDRDGRVSFNEFDHFLHLSGNNRMIDPMIFTLLDVHQDGSLEFSEFLIFYYILQNCHRHVRCSHSGATPAGQYFTDSNMGLAYQAPFFQAPVNHQLMGFTYHQPINYAAFFNQEAPHMSQNQGLANQGPLFQAPPNHQQMGFTYHQPNSTGGNFQHYGAFNDQVAPPVRLNQEPTTNPGASSGGCCCGSNNNEPIPVAVMANYKPPLSNSEKLLEAAKKAGKGVVHCATVVGAGAAVLALFLPVGI